MASLVEVPFRFLFMDVGHNHCLFGNTTPEEVEAMKKEEKKPITWEAADPKPPVVECGHLENRKENSQ